MSRDEAQPATAQLKMAPLSRDRRGKPSSVLSWPGTALEGGLATPALLLPVMLTTSEVEADVLQICADVISQADVLQICVLLGRLHCTKNLIYIGENISKDASRLAGALEETSDHTWLARSPDHQMGTSHH